MSFHQLGNVAFSIVAELAQKRFAERDRAFDKSQRESFPRFHSTPRGGSGRDCSNTSGDRGRSYAVSGRSNGDRELEFLVKKGGRGATLSPDLPCAGWGPREPYQTPLWSIRLKPRTHPG